jgi:mannose-6-phosphate isomerase
MSKIFTPSSLLKLQGAIQHYEWGGYDFIPRLLGVENQRQRPFAELWIGAHAKSPSLVVAGKDYVPLNDLISRDAERILGKDTAKRFQNHLPYLLKVLDARQMLSIQAHPDKRQAEKGFARENAAGISLKAARRNYKDDNHKPEAHVSLTEFWMLHGFRPSEEIAAWLDSTPEVSKLMPDFPGRKGSLQGTGIGPADSIRLLYALIMELPQEEVDALLRPLLARLRGSAGRDKNHPDYWALRAAAEFPLPEGHIDRGLFSIYLLNLVHLQPGQGTYQPAGFLHAYLEGTTIEIMANSDNVLRGGLTPKYVDVPELMRILKFEGRRPNILEGKCTSEHEKVYLTPSREFELSSIHLQEEKVFQNVSTHSADSVILLRGKAKVQAGQETCILDPGGICLISADVPYSIAGVKTDAVLFKASIPPE